MKKELLKSLPFDIAARLPLQLGRDSIGSSTAAITELIKNSYDANAESVRISFINREKKISRIQIEDDGDGMDQELLEKVWLRIGTEHKSLNEVSKGKHRVLTGAKGLGRLGIDRLCRRAILQTKTADMDHVLELHINWEMYSKKNATISGVTHKIFKIPFLQGDKHSDFFKTRKNGTRLLLIGMREQWKDKRIADLGSELSLLVSPFAESDGITDFSIDLKSGTKDVDGLLSSERVLSAATWKVTAEISDKFEVKLTYTHPESGFNRTLDNISWSEWFPERGPTPRCGPLDLKFFYIPQPASEISPSVSKKDWSAFMTLQHGVRIYRDKFRVRPYGEPTGRGDWLDLGLRKTSSPGGIKQGGWRVAPRQLLGGVFISRIKNESLEDQANREGMVETDGFFDLRAFALKVISEFELVATDFARTNSDSDSIDNVTKKLEESITRSEKAVESLAKTVSESESLNRTADIKTKLLEMQQFVEQTKVASALQREAYESKTEELEREKDTLANLASLGILTICFGHEAREFCNLAALAAVEIKESYTEGKFMVLPAVEGPLLRDLDMIIESTKFIHNFAAFSLGNVSKDKRKKGVVNIRKVAERVTSALGETLSRQHIRVDINDIAVGAQLNNSYEIDWESIFINMISNSVWALSKTLKNQRVIKISTFIKNSGIEIEFKDSGCGLESGTEVRIFEPMFSTRRDEKGTTIGTGMGLSIVKTFVVEHSAGTLTAYANSDLGGAKFSMLVPGGSLQ